MIAQLRAREEGASLVLALGLILILTFAMATIAMFTLSDMTSTKVNRDQNAHLAATTAAQEEALVALNSGAAITNVTESKAKTTLDGKYRWYVEFDAASSKTTGVVKTFPIGEPKRTTGRSLSSMPAKGVYPSPKAVRGGKSSYLMYEPTLEGYYQSAFHGGRMGDLSRSEGRWSHLLDTSSNNVNTYSSMVDSKMLSYNPGNGANLNPATSTGKGAWSTSLGFRVDDGTPTEITRNTLFDQEKFYGVNESDIKSGDAENLRKNCSGCSRVDRINYGYDISYDALDNQFNRNCPTQINWKASQYNGILDPNLNGGCFNSLEFDVDTRVLANSDIVYARSVIVRQDVKVNADKTADHFHLVATGPSYSAVNTYPSLRMYPGSQLTGLVTALGTNSCYIFGNSVSKVNVYGSMTCMGKYQVSQTSFWWDETLENKWKNNASVTRLWSYDQ